MRYFSDVFYQLKDNTLENKKRVLNWAKLHSYRWWVDELIHANRQKLDMSWEEILAHFEDEAHFVIIHRRGYTTWKEGPLNIGWRLEIGFRTMREKDIFLFIHVREDFLDELLKQFDLQVR